MAYKTIMNVRVKPETTKRMKELGLVATRIAGKLLDAYIEKFDQFQKQMLDEIEIQDKRKKTNL